MAESLVQDQSRDGSMPSSGLGAAMPEPEVSNDTSTPPTDNASGDEPLRSGSRPMVFRQKSAS
ncbi:hypothetical protein KHP62_03530 [Rhodobacteraceae bacterium NNCM2]|nr:hypothetical protein [Coraliihabitans acroporae]